MRKLLPVILFLAVLMCSCSILRQVREVPVPVETIRTEYINSIEYDSIFIKDSVDRVVNGDSVIIYKEHTKYVYKFLTDTVVKIDTVPTIVEVTTTIEKEVNILKWYQKLLMGLGGVGFLILVIIITHKITRFKIR